MVQTRLSAEYRHRYMQSLLGIIHRMIQSNHSKFYVQIQHDHDDARDGTHRIFFQKRRYPRRSGSFVTFSIENAYSDLAEFEIDYGIEYDYSPSKFTEVFDRHIKIPKYDNSINIYRFVNGVEVYITYIHNTLYKYQLRPDGSLQPYHYGRYGWESGSESNTSSGYTTSSGLASTLSGSTSSGAFDMPAYRAPSIEKSHFRSSVKTGSRSLHSSNYTGSGSHKKLRNGILQTELENTASSKPHTMVYVKNDPTKLLAPLESWKRLPGQLHPLTRQPLGHTNLRKVKTIGKIMKKKK